MSKPTTVRFHEEEVRRLEALARRQGTTISALIQRAVRTFYLDEAERKADGAEALLTYIQEHPDDGSGPSLEAIEARIVEEMGRAATG